MSKSTAKLAKSVAPKSVAPKAPPVTPVTIPAAPHQAPMGIATKGGHHIANALCLRAQRTGNLFVPATTLTLQGANPWRPNTPGHVMYTKVLAPLAAAGNGTFTYEAFCTAAVAAGFKATGTYGATAHLIWLYTYGVYLQANGTLYGQAGALPVAATPVAGTNQPATTALASPPVA
jgi:hypothetical protein